MRSLLQRNPFVPCTVRKKELTNERMYIGIWLKDRLVTVEYQTFLLTKHLCLLTT